MTAVRVCPGCGEQNAAHLVFCTKCMMDISTVAPAVQSDPEAVTVDQPAQPHSDATTMVNPNPAPPGTAVCSLELVSDSNVMFHVRDGQVVGRGEKADVRITNVPDVDAISRLHARFFCRNGQWYAQYLGSTNFMKVDGQTYTDKDTEVAVYDGSIVVFSLTPFTFRVVD